MSPNKLPPEKMSSLMGDLEPNPIENVILKIPKAAENTISKTQAKAPYSKPTTLEVLVNANWGLTKITGYVNGISPLKIRYRLYRKFSDYLNEANLPQGQFLDLRYICESTVFTISGPGISKAVPNLFSDTLQINGKRSFELKLTEAMPGTYYLSFWQGYSRDVYAKLRFSEGFWTRSS